MNASIHTTKASFMLTSGNRKAGAPRAKRWQRMTTNGGHRSRKNRSPGDRDRHHGKCVTRETKLVTKIVTLNWGRSGFEALSLQFRPLDPRVPILAPIVDPLVPIVAPVIAPLVPALAPLLPLPPLLP
jgi:hypothetical protein